MAKQPEPRRTLTGEIRRDRQQARRRFNSSAFFGTGFHPTADNGVQSDNFDGDLNAGDPGTRGWAMDSDQAAFGELLLRPGSVGNDTLTSPVVPAVGHGDGVNFTLLASPATPSIRASVTIPVPAGYTRAMVTATASLSAFNPTATSDYVYVSALIYDDTDRGYAMPQGAPPGDSATTSQTATALLTGLGASILVQASAHTNAVAFTTSTSGNVCNIDATVLFLR